MRIHSTRRPVRLLLAVVASLAGAALLTALHAAILAAALLPGDPTGWTRSASLSAASSETPRLLGALAGFPGGLSVGVVVVAAGVVAALILALLVYWAIRTRQRRRALAAAARLRRSAETVLAAARGLETAAAAELQEINAGYVRRLSGAVAPAGASSDEVAVAQALGENRIGAVEERVLERAFAHLPGGGRLQLRLIRLYRTDEMRRQWTAAAEAARSEAANWQREASAAIGEADALSAAVRSSGRLGSAGAGLAAQTAKVIERSARYRGKGGADLAAQLRQKAVALPRPRIEADLAKAARVAEDWSAAVVRLTSKGAKRLAIHGIVVVIHAHALGHTILAHNQIVQALEHVVNNAEAIYARLPKLITNRIDRKIDEVFATVDGWFGGLLSQIVSAKLEPALVPLFKDLLLKEYQIGHQA